jgi:hypothetical protein
MLFIAIDTLSPWHGMKQCSTAVLLGEKKGGRYSWRERGRMEEKARLGLLKKKSKTW